MHLFNGENPSYINAVIAFTAIVKSLCESASACFALDNYLRQWNRR